MNNHRIANSFLAIAAVSYTHLVLYLVDEEGQRRQPELYENQFVIIKADQSRKKTQLGRIEGNKVVPLEFKKAKPYGVEPRSAGQYFLQEALMMPSEKAPLVLSLIHILEPP